MKIPIRLQMLAYSAVAFGLSLSCASLLPKPEDTCKAGDAVCQADGNALECVSGKYVKVHCPGPKRCAMGDKHVISCDQSEGIEPGDFCPQVEEGQAQCNGNHSAALKCSSGVWLSTLCPGSCVVMSGQVECE